MSNNDFFTVIQNPNIDLLLISNTDISTLTDICSHEINTVGLIYIATSCQMQRHCWMQ